MVSSKPLQKASEKVKPLKSKFIEGIKNRIVSEEHMTEDEAEEKVCKFGKLFQIVVAIALTLPTHSAWHMILYTVHI